MGASSVDASQADDIGREKTSDFICLGGVQTLDQRFAAAAALRLKLLLDAVLVGERPGPRVQTLARALELEFNVSQRGQRMLEVTREVVTGQGGQGVTVRHD